MADIPKEVVIEPFEPPMPRCLPRFQQLFEELTFGPRAGWRIIVCWILVMDTLCRIVKRIEKLSRVYLHVVALFINFCLDQMCGTRVIFSGICMSCMSLTLWLMWAPSWRSGGLCLAPLSDLLFFHRGLACPTTFSHHWMVRWSSPMPLLGSSQLSWGTAALHSVRWEDQRRICCEARDRWGFVSAGDSFFDWLLKLRFWYL